MKEAKNVLTRNHVTHVATVKDILDEVVDVRGQMDKLQPTIEQIKDRVFNLSQPGVHVETIPLPTQYFLVPQGPLSQVVQFNGTSNFLVPETPSELAARISQLNKAREELKKIEKELADLREQQRDLVAQRHEADSKEQLEKAGEQRVRLSLLKEQRELEQRLKSLDKALRRTNSLRDGMETVAAYVPWNVEVEGEAIWQSLMPKGAKAAR